MRALWLSIGILSLGTGIAGAMLPLLPTTPFLILASYAFARSSARLYDWLHGHPRLGPPIRDWSEHGAIGPSAKRLAAAAMIATWLASLAAGAGPGLLAIQAAVLAVACGFVLSRPSPPAPRAAGGSRL